MVCVTVDTEPVKGYVVIRYNSLDGPVVAEGTAPVTGCVSGQWVACFQFGEVPGYKKPDDDCNLVTGDKSYTYRYEPLPTPKYKLTIESERGGTTNPPPGTYEYEEGSNVSVSAQPDPGYRFKNWLLDGTRTIEENPTVVTMDADHTIRARFEEIPKYTLHIEAGEGGTTDPPPGDYEYLENSSVSVTAIPDEGYEFDFWLLDGAQYTSNPITVTMDADHELSAYFKEVEKCPFRIPILCVIWGSLPLRLARRRRRVLKARRSRSS